MVVCWIEPQMQSLRELEFDLYFFSLDFTNATNLRLLEYLYETTTGLIRRLPGLGLSNLGVQLGH